ncbi:MAG: hypothetical protein Q7S22_02245 [Candidatus Micrarchaeota archaeon]|nr:hypothetical protein [Candidatus Micrarchaeota archaeon]
MVSFRPIDRIILRGMVRDARIVKYAMLETGSVLLRVEYAKELDIRIRRIRQYKTNPCGQPEDLFRSVTKY